MSKKETDILLIRKYLNGELDARAMHQLERRAQSDPFLMDALEGYENAGNNQQPQLDDLSSRLQQRVERKERRIIPWRNLAIAASVLIVLSVGGLLLFNSKKPALNQTAVVIPPVAKPKSAEPAVLPDENKEKLVAAAPLQKKRIEKISRANASADAAPVISADQIASAPVATKQTDKAVKDTTPLNEMVVMGYATQKKKNVTASITTIKADTIDNQLNDKVAGVSISRNLQETRIRLFSNKLIKGKVVDGNDGAPLPGVTVKIAGSNIGTQTNANGYFNLPADSTKNTSLLFGYLGYQSLRVDANTRDSLKTIKLQPSSSSLSEVVVTKAYGIQRNNNDAEVISAHPADGWDSFNKYLKENAISPDGKSGVVKLSFVVDESGAISDVKVIKGLSPLTDKKAIDLINNSPDWTGSSNHQPETVRVKVKFAKK